MSPRSRFGPTFAGALEAIAPALTHWTAGLKSHVSRLVTCLSVSLRIIVDWTSDSQQERRPGLA